mgnify:CR=1 FL=1
MRKVIISSLVAIAAMSSVCYTTKTSVESSSTLTLKLWHIMNRVMTTVVCTQEIKMICVSPILVLSYTAILTADIIIMV